MWWEFTWIGGLGQEREESAAGKRWRRKVLNSFRVPFFIRSKVQLLDSQGHPTWGA